MIYLTSPPPPHLARHIGSWHASNNLGLGHGCVLQRRSCLQQKQSIQRKVATPPLTKPEEPLAHDSCLSGYRCRCVCSFLVAIVTDVKVNRAPHELFLREHSHCSTCNVQILGGVMGIKQQNGQKKKNKTKKKKKKRPRWNKPANNLTDIITLQSQHSTRPKYIINFIIKKLTLNSQKP